jgi:hypothetical protein
MTLVLPRQVRVADPVRVSGLVIGALGLGAIATVQPRLSMAVALGLSLVAVVAARPVVGVYLLVVLTPLTAGIDRGTLVPVLRPNEALCGLVAMALLARGLVRLRTARDVTFRVDPMLGAVLALAMTSSVVPLLWMRVQGHAVTSDDVLYALLMWKYVVVFLIVRAAKLTEQQIWRTLFLSVATAAVISAISLLQTAGWAPVVTLLKTYFTTNDNVEAITSSRGSSTLGLPIAVADLLTFNLAIVMGVIWLRRRTTALLLAAALMLTLGVVGAGEFSGLLGLILGVVVLCVLTRSAFSARFLLIGGAISIPVLWPVIETRLAGFQSLSGLPISWTGRLDNLRSYFWPVLFSEHRYLLGVRPAARVPAPHRANGFIWIESGYTWLLWAGGIPLLLAFVWFVIVACRVARQAIRSDSDAKRITGLATFVAVSVISVLMIFDPHLTYRGVADELFALLALSTTAVPKPTPEEPK